MKEAGKHNFDSKVIVSVGSPKTDRIADEFYKAIEWNKKHPNKPPKPRWVTPPENIKTVIEDFKLPFGDEADIEKSGKKKHDNTAFLIVSDMLLTGYDVPIAACLYLDKSLKEHNLLQAIARVNRSRTGKNAGFIMDYYGITSELIAALKLFSGEIELRSEDILKNLSEELPKLAMQHSKLVNFFKPLRISRQYKREQFIDAALQYIEAIDKRDTFKSLLKQFNKAINIVLPSAKAMPYRSDFQLFNEIRLRAKNAFPDDEELKVTQEESQMLQALIDEHLKAEGVTNLLEEPVSIIDREKFEEEIENASPATKELKMRNQLKYIIKVGLDKNSDFYKPLAQRLEELLQQKEAQRISEAQLLLAYAELQNTIIDEQKEAENQGFDTHQKREIYQSLKIIFGEKATDATQTVFDLIEGELGIVEWYDKGRVKKDIVKKITRYFQSIGFTRPAAKAKAESILDLLVRFA